MVFYKHRHLTYSWIQNLFHEKQKVLMALEEMLREDCGDEGPGETNSTFDPTAYNIRAW